MSVLKINGEEHFKVVGRNFCIGAAESEYELCFSPDNQEPFVGVGKKCPAGEVCAVVDVPQAIYWKLSGNTGDVKINL